MCFWLMLGLFHKDSFININFEDNISKLYLSKRNKVVTLCRKKKYQDKFNISKKLGNDLSKHLKEQKSKELEKNVVIKIFAKPRHLIRKYISVQSIKI